MLSIMQLCHVDVWTLESFLQIPIMNMDFCLKTPIHNIYFCKGVKWKLKDFYTTEGRAKLVNLQSDYLNEGGLRRHIS